MLNKKSQIFTIDFFMALFVFFVLLTIIMVNWNNYYYKIDESKEYSKLTNQAFQISNTLVKSGGTPDSWTSSDVKIIGLAESDRILSPTKVNYLMSIPLNVTREILQTYNYNFSISISDLGGNILHKYGHNSSIPTKSVNIRRYVLYNDENSILEFAMWKEK